MNSKVVDHPRLNQNLAAEKDSSAASVETSADPFKGVTFDLDLSVLHLHRQRTERSLVRGSGAAASDRFILSSLPRETWEQVLSQVEGILGDLAKSGNRLAAPLFAAIDYTDQAIQAFRSEREAAGIGFLQKAEVSLKRIAERSITNGQDAFVPGGKGLRSAENQVKSSISHCIRFVTSGERDNLTYAQCALEDAAMCVLAARQLMQHSPFSRN